MTQSLRETGSGMNSRGPNGSAEATAGAARPAGMSLGQWLNTKIAEPAPVQRAYAPPTPQQPYAPSPTAMAAGAVDSLAEIHQRLDGITRQIDQMSQRRAGVASAPTASGLANQLNDAISRLDTRLSNLTQSAQQARPTPPSYPAQGFDAVERAAAEIRQSAAYHTSPPLSPAGIDAAIAEISARRHSLNNGAGIRAGAESVHAACAGAAAGPCTAARAGPCTGRSLRHRAAAQQPDQPDGGAAPPGPPGPVDCRRSAKSWPKSAAR